jgi:hypothetical protein
MAVKKARQTGKRLLALDGQRQLVRMTLELAAEFAPVTFFSMSERRLSVSDVARVAVDDFKKASGGALTPVMAAELASIIKLALITAVRDERRTSVVECTRRAELWEKTGDKTEATAPLRAEARARASEARYIGDLIATRR